MGTGDPFVVETRASTPALRGLVEHAPDAIFVADSDGRYMYVNQAGCRLLGYSRAELVGKTIVELIPAEDIDRLARAKDRMLRGQTDAAEWKLRRKDGSWVPVEVNANILPNGQWYGFVRDISERKALEAERDALFERMDAKRRRLQAVLDTVPLGLILVESDGSLSFNRRTEELLGMKLSTSEGNAQIVGRILRPDGRPAERHELVSSRVLQGETVVAEEFIVERPDGTRIPVLASGAPIRDEQGAINGGIGVFQDVSERMRAEQAIRENERLLNAIFGILPVGLWIADRSGRIVRGNPAGERVWRGARYVDVSEFGQYKGWWLDTGKPIEAEQWALARALTKGETSTGELVRIQCFDGSFKTIINSAVPLRGERGEIDGAIVVNEDITALHEAQEKLRASEYLFRTAFDLLPVGLWIADAQGRITYANPAGQRIWAGTRFVGPERFGEYKAWWVDSGKEVAPEEWGIARAVRRGETTTGELIRIQCFDGSSKTVTNWAAPIRSESGEITGAIAVNEDVTALYRTQQQLRTAVRDREDLLAVVSHDLRNPLSGLMMGATAAGRAAEKLPGGEPVRALAANLVDITRRMAGLVDDLLAVAVAETGRSMLKIAPMSGSALLARAAEAARPLLARHEIDLRVAAVGSLPAVQVDSDRVLRVFANLLDNALKFTEPGGTVTMRAEVASAGVRYCVANSGPALSDEERENMFLPFWQAGREDRRGAGLGLSICRSIIEAHGGTIWAEPAEGARVRICFLLPRVKPEAARASGP